MAQLKRLKIGAIDKGLHAKGFEMIGNVLHGYFAATHTGRTPLKRIGGQKMHMIGQALGQVLSQALGQTFGQALGQVLAQVLSQALGQALGQTLG